MLYKKAVRKELDEQLFKNPTSEYRGAPFWAWNCKLERQRLLEEIDDLKTMGMGGAHIHSRIGLNTPYLSNEFFQYVDDCCKKMEENSMLCWLYDEDRWPSGSAGGFVTKEMKYRIRFLVFEPWKIQRQNEEAFMAAAKAVRSNQKNILGYYYIQLDESGYLESYERVEEPGNRENIWVAYLEISGDSPWFNNQSYVNTLDKKAINRFIELTHEKYYEQQGHRFGSTIPAIFTDEPQVCHKERLNHPFEKRTVILPFTDDFPCSYKEIYGKDLLEHLPELIWNKTNEQVSQIRYYYHRHICERFSEAFGDNIGQWCKKHKIVLTGHMMNEWTLYSQTMAIGEAMRPMKYFGLPGIDMLCDRRELSTAKQAQSISHQMGREGVMSELYGVTGWDFDFRNHKLSGDWQAALGVTVRVPHLTWVSMEGEAKRDYPASIGYQSPWYQQYSYIEDHFARLNTALTRGKPRVSVGVIHPIESYWLYWGDRQQDSIVRQVLESNFENIIEWLLYGLIDFDFISEAVLSEEEKEQSGNTFIMGEMNYDVVILPECHTLRTETYERLREFQKEGGLVIVMGKAPCFLDGVETEEIIQLTDQAFNIPFHRGSLLSALEAYREVDIVVRTVDGVDSTQMKHKEEGNRSNNMFYQLRDDGVDKWLFLTHVNRPVNEMITYTEELKIMVKGEYQPILYDTLTGNIQAVNPEYVSGRTIITYYTSFHDSLLFCLKPRLDMPIGVKPMYQQPSQKRCLPQPEKLKLEELNVYLLDLAQYAFDDEDWREEEEILRIDNLFREKLNYPLRMEALAQPWINQETAQCEHLLRLRFEIYSEIEVEGCQLAMEHPEVTEVYLNGNLVPNNDVGWYVDKSIRCVSLGTIQKDLNILEIRIPFWEKANIEWCYLLGKFGVKVCGRHKVLELLPKKIYYGDITRQGLPFYAGNFNYEISVECEKGILYIEVPQYRGALIQVSIDDKQVGKLVFAPYILNCGRVEEGTHTIKLTVFGNRINAFGAIHHTDDKETWYGPNLWRTEGNKWSYEYQLKEMGILTTPQYWIKKVEDGGKDCSQDRRIK